MEALVFLTLAGLGLNVMAVLAIWAHYRIENAYWRKVQRHKADAWQEGIDWAWEPGQPDHTDSNPYRKAEHG